jgi:hypothetical protein
MQAVEQAKCTKLDNEGKATTDIEIQKEMLAGRYKI